MHREAFSKNRWLRGALLLLAVVLLCAVANLLGFAVFRSEHIMKNTAQYAVTHESEGRYPTFVNGGYDGTRLDNFTDAWILLIASYNGPESAAEKAFGGYYWEEADVEDMNPDDILIHYWQNHFAENADPANAPPLVRGEYARYWHGYILPLRILLTLFDYSTLRVLNMDVQFLLLLAVVLAFYRRLRGRFLLPFLLTLLPLYPGVAALSLQFAPVFYLTMALLLYLLLRGGEARGRGLSVPLAFALTGVLVNFFDLLTYPLLSLCLPLMVLCLLRTGERAGKQGLTVASCTAAWFLGYGGMWGLKWLLSGAVLHRDVVQEAIGAILYRTGVTGDTAIDIGEMLRANYRNAFGVAFLILCALVLLGGALVLWLRRRRGQDALPGADAAACAWMVAVALLPVVWMVILKNHSYIHSWFTYRILAAQIFAAGCAAESGLRYIAAGSGADKGPLSYRRGGRQYRR